MELCTPDVKLIKQQPGIDGIYQAIAMAARVCYASEKADGNKEMVERLIKMHHHRPLEFGTVYLKVPSDKTNWRFYVSNNWSKIRSDGEFTYITTNYRVLFENDLLSDLEYLVDFIPTKHAYRMTLLWDINRDIADEFRTHLSLSSLMQSSRYCNYSKDKFSNQIRIFKPFWYDTNSEWRESYINAIETAELRYMELCSMGAPADVARGVLPLDVATQFIQCGYLEDWEHFIDLRFYGTTGKPHPDAKLIAYKAAKLYDQEFRFATRTERTSKY